VSGRLRVHINIFIVNLMSFKKFIFDFFEYIKDCKAEFLISWNFHIPKNKPINFFIV
jgi:hypothetical protein